MAINRPVNMFWPGLVVLAIYSQLTGCATMMSPGSDEITIKTEPSGAQVYDGAELIGTTPLKHTFKRDTFTPKTLTLRKKGYTTQDLPLQRTTDENAILNFGFFITTCGATSWGIDAMSGHMTKYAPNSYLIDLKRSGGAASLDERINARRLQFVLLNQDRLRRDIAGGDGEYLRAYFALGQSGVDTGAYPEFRRRVSTRSQALLEVHDPIDLHHQLAGPLALAVAP